MWSIPECPELMLVSSLVRGREVYNTVNILIFLALSHCLCYIECTSALFHANT